MTRAIKLIAVAGSVLTALVGGAAILTPSLAPAQKAQPEPSATAALPPGYVGGETCKGVSRGPVREVPPHQDGTALLEHPRNSREGLACETCHGPGKAHVDAGGGKGKNGLITFAKSDTTPVDQRNAVCLTCHNKGAHLFWQGSAHEARDVACTGCHKVMEDVSPQKPAGQADRARDLRHVPHPAAGGRP